MCGRYALIATLTDFEKDFGVEGPPPEVPIADRYNIAPTQPVLIVREDRDSGSGRRELAHVVWGLIPPWADSPDIGPRMINARAETAAEKPAFRHAFKRRRCLIPASGFYEWQKVPAGDASPSAAGAAHGNAEPDFFGSEDKERRPSSPADGPRARGGLIRRPWFFYLRGHRPFAFAGLWEVWNGPHGELLESCTILTTKADGPVAPIHERMPVIVPPSEYDHWLDPFVQDPREVQALLRSFDSPELEAYPVSPLVNRPGNDGPRLIERQTP